MPTSPIYALAHMFLPNFIKLKGPATVMSALERKDKIFLDPLFQQAYVTHNPDILTQDQGDYRVAVISLPKPKEMGEAFMAALVLKRSDPPYNKYFTLEHDYFMAQKRDRTLVNERIGKDQVKHGEGPAITGNFATDAEAFIAAFMETIVSTKVTRK